MTKRLTTEEKNLRKRAKLLRKREKLRNKYRGTVCPGCRHNRYNYQDSGNGWDAPTSGSGCWTLEDVKRGKCPGHSDYNKR